MMKISEIGRFTALTVIQQVAGGQGCNSAPSSPPTNELIALINHLQALIAEFAVYAAAFAYAVAGLYWMRGTLESQETARRIFVSATVGFVIIQLSDGIIGVIQGPLCGGP